MMDIWPVEAGFFRFKEIIGEVAKVICNKIVWIKSVRFKDYMF